MRAETDFKEGLKNAGLIVVVVPSQFFRGTVKKINEVIKSNNILIVSATKGIENDTLCRMSEILLEEIPGIKNRLVVLSGPSHAEEVSREVPTAVVCSAFKKEVSCKIQDIFKTSYFRIYTNSDIIGVECGGSLKNIIAIATGILDGIGLGDNAKAALMTRGLAEMSRLGEKLGARKSTFAGLSGMGDLIVTCMSKFSRNRAVGELLGKGKTLKKIMQNMDMVAEGIPTTKSVYVLSKKLKVDMPIVNEVYAILFKDKSAKTAVINLMSRSVKSEEEGF